MIKHIECDVFKAGADFVLHQVNCQGVMGSGVAKQVRDNYPIVFEKYKEKCDKHNPRNLLGKAQYVGTYIEYETEFLGIFNLFAQEKYGYDGKCYTDYDSLKECLEMVAESIRGVNNSLSAKEDQLRKIAIPYLMGCHRGGGCWKTVIKIIEDTLEGFDVLICKYNGG